MVIGSIGSALAILWIVFSPQRQLREMPEPVEDAPPEPRPEGAVRPAVEPA